MFEFLVLLGITGGLVVLAVIRLVTSKFPSGADLAQLSTFYYSVPLSILAFLSINLRQMAFLNEIAANAELAIISLRYVCVAMVGIELGRYLGRMMGAARFTYVFSVNEASAYRTAVLTCAVLLLFPAGVALFGVQSFLQGYATESLAAGGDTGTALIYSAIEALGITLAFIMIMRLSLGRLPIKPLFLLSLASIAVIFVIRVKRLEVVSALVPLAIILFASRSRVKATVWRVLLGAGLLLALAVVSATRVSERLDLQTIIFYFLSEGLYAGHSLPGIVNRLDINMTGYEYGMRFLNSVLAFVPSFLWPGKTEVVYGPDLIFEGISPLGATTMLTEIVLQGGVVAVAIFYTLLGLFFERVERFQEGWDEAVATGCFPARFGLYLISVSVFIPHFRDGVIPALKLTLQGLAYFAILVAVHRMDSRPTATAEGRLGGVT
ncbi:oligosaccharide repeat unit polymerase [Sphingomonas dokdonensis]|uniref:Uncharacterized protein n=1 Tax=Sphingomonas dokdonensis TaxID=344880 RepID=A0A2D0A4L2_9SPHN|nr:oligosaccharide repeat unit polymerase [Sphingomonas dokdonensis]OWK27837.1 hypothetical protein SPDO_30770 [Sphingomonas dokdonensis]